MGCTEARPALNPDAAKYWEDAESLVEYSNQTTDEVYFRMRPEVPRTIHFARKGCASIQETPPRTLCEIIASAAQRHNSDAALCVEVEEDEDCVWKTWSWTETLEESRNFAKALLGLGAERYQGITVWGFNSPHFAFTFFGSAMAGTICAGIYPTDTPDTMAYKTHHIDARVAVCQSVSHVDQYRKKIDSIPSLTHIVIYGEHQDEFSTITREDGSVVQVYSWINFMKLGSTVPQKALDESVSRVKPEDCVSVVYTSGTTGVPKATMLSHDNLIYCFLSVKRNLGNFAGSPELAERVVSYLPLSHIVALQCDIVGPAVTAADSPGNATTYFARPTDLKTGRLVSHRLPKALPTFFLGVPLIWEKIQAKLQEIGSKTTGLKRFVADWAKSIALDEQQNLQFGGSQRSSVWAPVVNTFILSKIKQKLGLSECRFAITGASPISSATLRFFAALSISIHEGYGASESSGVITMTSDRFSKWGSIGRPLEGCEVKVLDESGNQVPFCEDLSNPQEQEQGEICFRGRNVMLGYMAAKDGSDEEQIRKKNASVITPDGWCKTGDKGACDKYGMFRFTGRFKELLKGKGGEIIAPVPIEEAVVSRAPGISKAILIGNEKDYNVLLVTLQQHAANGEYQGDGKLAGAAAKVSVNSSTTVEAAKDAVWIDHVRSAITGVNQDQRICLNRAFRVRKFAILEHDFSIDKSELTPTLKSRRDVIAQNYAEVVASLYRDSPEGDQVEYVNVL